MVSIRLGANQIESVGSYSIYDLPNLSHLSLSYNPIQHIKEFAFATSNSSSHLEIYLQGLITSASFQPLSLAGINRPTTLNLGGPNLKTLNKEAFSQYFLKHPQHKVYWYSSHGGLTCDCDMYWLWAKRDIFREHFNNYPTIDEPLYCEGFDNTVIWDMKKEDFGDCHLNESSFDLKYHLFDNEKYYYL